MCLHKDDVLALIKTNAFREIDRIFVLLNIIYLYRLKNRDSLSRETRNFNNVYHKLPPPPPPKDRIFKIKNCYLNFRITSHNFAMLIGCSSEREECLYVRVC